MKEKLEEGYKRCTKCKTIKSVDSFNKKHTIKSGIRSTCKECDKKYRTKTKEHFKEYRKEYIQKNKDKIKEHVQKYRKENIEIIKQRKEKPIANLDDLKKKIFGYSASIDKCKSYITTTSNVFSIHVTATSGVAKASAVIVVLRENDKIEKIAVISG
jgi:hypothetical protein